MTTFTRCALLLTVIAGCGAGGEPPLLGLSYLRGQTIEVKARSLEYTREAVLYFPLPPVPRGSPCPELSPTLSISYNGVPTGADRGGEIYEGEDNVPSGKCKTTATGGSQVKSGPAVFSFDDGGDHAEIQIDVPARALFELVDGDRPAQLNQTLVARVPGDFFAAHADAPPTFELAHFIPLDPADPVPWSVGREEVLSTGADGSTDIAVEVAVPGPGRYQLYLGYSTWVDWVPMPIARCEGFAACTGTTFEAYGSLGPVEVTVIWPQWD
jgi:hypothetical protein